ncbi:hypothetical protein LTR24_006146 [Lithohypha guttulata]|uniref:Piwi domain-containing protein n=1 Tax=Lithohypha guttulata TaxID=1690604 RepID=A0ABR0K7Q5_9EURO|nr:hypothetical protein LTR24_006146 [Lithohypha guttulata]
MPPKGVGKSYAAATKTPNTPAATQQVHQGLLPVPPKIRQDGLFKSNHFRIKIKDDYKLYRYPITAILEPKKPKQDGKDDAAESSSDESTNAQRPDGFRKAKLSARQRRRLIFLLLENLRERDKDLVVASNYVDTLVSTKPMEKSEAPPTDILLSFYDEDEVSPSARATQYTISLGRVKAIEVGRLSQHLKNPSVAYGSFSDVDAGRNEVAEVLNIALSDHVNNKTTRWARTGGGSDEPTVAPVVANKFFRHDSPFQLGRPPHQVPNDAGRPQGLCAIPGFFRSARSVYHQDLLLNVNTTTSAFYKWINLGRLIQEREPNAPALPNETWRKLESFISGLRVRTTYMVASNRRSHERILTVKGFASTDKYYVYQKLKADKKEKRPLPTPEPAYPSNSQRGPFANQVTFSKKHFKDANKTVIPGRDLIVRCGSEGPLFPVSVLEVLPGQFWKQKTDLADIASHDPLDNYRTITQEGARIFGFQANGPDGQGTTLTPFGLSLATGTNSDAALIDVPVYRYPMTDLRYINAANGADAFVGSNPWFLTNRQAIQPAGVPRGASDSKLVSKWTLIEIRSPGMTGQGDHELQSFVEAFQKQMKGYGMVNFNFHRYPDGWDSHRLGWNNSVRDTLFNRLENIMASSVPPQFVVIVLPRRDLDLYATVKRVAELDVGATVVCCVPKGQRLPSDPNNNNQYNIRANMISKINLKSDSTAAGHGWRHTPALLKGETMVVGMDVTHPGPGSLEKVPRVAAMVASHDRNFAQWPASLRANPRPERPKKGQPDEKYKKSQEKIVHLEEMLVERLDCYTRMNKGQLRKKIIFFRDGLSEAQFTSCKDEEIPQLRKAIAKVYQPENRPDEWRALPRIMVVCAVKRHHTRFYAPPGDKLLIPNKKGNAKHPVPGITVFEGVTNGKYDDFYMISQVTQLGTARPTHYVVLENEFLNEFNITDVAQATFDLSFMFGRCTSSVGLTTPAYFADKACDRARCYMRRIYVGNAPNAAPWDPVNHPLPLTVHGRLRDRMWYI